MTETPQSQQHNKEPNGDTVKLPRWMWSLVSRLLGVLALGAVLTLVASIFWLFFLTNIQLKNTKQLENVGNAIKKIQKEVDKSTFSKK